MNIKLLSDLVLKDKIEESVLYSYFIIWKNELGISELLPADNHAAAFPLKLDDKRNVLFGDINFFNKPFFNGFSDKLNLEGDVEYHIKEPGKSDCIIINLLDNCFGHSVLKMFNIVLFYQKYASTHDLFVICPTSLLSYLPVDKLNVCSIKKTYSEFGKGIDLSPVINRIKEMYSNIDYAFLNTYQDFFSKSEQYDFLNLAGNEKLISEAKYIVFYYRKDKVRRWGMRHQKQKIIGLFRFLQPYFKDVNYVILGERDNCEFPSFIQDLRCDIFSTVIENKYNSILLNSIFVVGVHGSHLIIPSLLSEMVFHIVPPGKIKNTGEDVYNLNKSIINTHITDINLIVKSRIFFPGGKSMAQFILINYIASLEKEYKLKLGSENYHKAQLDFIESNHPYFNYQKAITWWNGFEASALRIQKVLKF